MKYSIYFINIKKYLLLIIIILLQYFISLSFGQNSNILEFLNYYSKLTSDNNTIYSIGISEPEMTDSILAKNLAINRALQIATILNHAEIRLVSDFFEYAYEDIFSNLRAAKNNIEELIKIESYLNYDSVNHNVVYGKFNEHKEYIVILKIQKKNNSSNLYVSSEFYRNEYDINDRSYYMNRQLSIYSNNYVDTSKLNHNYYNLKNESSRLSFIVNFEDKDIEVPRYYYSYISSIKKQEEIFGYTESAELKNGLWAAYIESILKSILYKTKTSNFVFRRVSDNNNENLDLNIKGLSRTVVSVKDIILKISRIGIFDNKLYIMLE